MSVLSLVSGRFTVFITLFKKALRLKQKEVAKEQSQQRAASA